MKKILIGRHRDLSSTEKFVIDKRIIKISRRDFLKTSLLTAGGLALSLGGYSWLIEPRWVEIVEQELSILNLPEELIGSKLIQISDMHIGNRYNWQYQKHILEEISSLDPEFVVYTGDFITYDSYEQFDQLKEIMTYAPYGKYGTLAVLGNHDYGHGWKMSEVAQTVENILEQNGIDVLRNEKKNINNLEFVGIDDYWGTNYDPEPVLDSLESDSPTIVLCHNPDVVDQPIWGDYQGVILSGHTHGGQVKPPFLPPPVIPVQNKNFTSGFIDLEDGRQLYINRGLGNLWSIRFNARPEITVFTLTSKAQ